MSVLKLKLCEEIPEIPTGFTHDSGTSNVTVCHSGLASSFSSQPISLSVFPQPSTKRTFIGIRLSGLFTRIVMRLAFPGIYKGFGGSAVKCSKPWPPKETWTFMLPPVSRSGARSGSNVMLPGAML